MPEQPGALAVAPGLAASLLAHRAAIVADYEGRLREMGSPLVLGDAERAQVLEQAGRVVEDVAERLRGDRADVPSDGRALSRGIGLDRAAHDVHPTESLLAASALHESVLVAGARLADGEPDSARLVLAVALATNDSIGTRVFEGAAAYAGFLLDKVHRAHVDERARIGRELHDQVGQGVSLAYRQLELFGLQYENEPALAVDRVEAAHASLRRTIESLARLTTGLRVTEELESLEKALRAYFDGAGYDVVSHLVINGDEAWAPVEVRDEVFVILREAIRNALRHGGATTIAVRVDVAPHEMRATVDDDGTGFDRSRITPGVGLESMAERAALLGGTVRLTSRPGRGTSVTVAVPFLGGGDDGRR